MYPLNSTTCIHTLRMALGRTPPSKVSSEIAYPTEICITFKKSQQKTIPYEKEWVLQRFDLIPRDVLSYRFY